MQWWERNGWYYDRYTNHTPDVHIDFNLMNFWNLNKGVLSWNVKKESSNIFTLYQDFASSCRWFSSKALNTKYTYKVISSIVKHVSTTEDEINWIDRDRYWEWWTLWWYYMDLKNAYDDIENNSLNILSGLSDMMYNISWTNNSINEYNENLSKLWENLDDINKRESLENELSNFKQELQDCNCSTGNDVYSGIVYKIELKQIELTNFKNNNPESTGDKGSTEDKTLTMYNYLSNMGLL